jgi:hypothetical protein
MAESEENRIRRNVNDLHKQSYVTNRNSYSRNSTIRIEGLQLKKGEAIPFACSLLIISSSSI